MLLVSSTNAKHDTLPHPGNRLSLYSPPIKYTSPQPHVESSFPTVCLSTGNKNAFRLTKSPLRTRLDFFRSAKERQILPFDMNTQPVTPQQSPLQQTASNTQTTITPFDDHNQQHTIKYSITDRKQSAPSFIQSLYRNKPHAYPQIDSSRSNCSYSAATSPVQWNTHSKLPNCNKISTSLSASPHRLTPNDFKTTKKDFHPLQPIEKRQLKARKKMIMMMLRKPDSDLSCAGTTKQQHLLTPQQRKEMKQKSSEQTQRLTSFKYDPNILVNEVPITEDNTKTNWAVQQYKSNQEQQKDSITYQESPKDGPEESPQILTDHTMEQKHNYLYDITTTENDHFNNRNTFLLTRHSRKIDFSMHVKSLGKNQQLSPRVSPLSCYMKSNKLDLSMHINNDSSVWDERAAHSLEKNKQIDYLNSPSQSFSMFGSDLNKRIHKIYLEEKPTADGKRKIMNLKGYKEYTKGIVDEQHSYNNKQRE